MTVVMWISITTAILGLVGALTKLLHQHRRRKQQNKSGRTMIFETGSVRHGEPAIIVQGWIEEDGTFTPNPDYDYYKDYRKN